MLFLMPKQQCDKALKAHNNDQYRSLGQSVIQPLAAKGQ